MMILHILPNFHMLAMETGKTKLVDLNFRYLTHYIDDLETDYLL